MLRKLILVGPLLLMLVFAGTVTAGDVRVRGSADLSAYGYDDPDGTSHLWLMQNTRFSLYPVRSRWSFHFSGGYLGDNEDDFSNSGRGRFLSGYLRYSGYSSPWDIRAGRFFLYHGVALGVFDGLDAGYTLKPGMSIRGFAGMMGPYSRRFEFEDPSKAFSYGGEFRYSPKRCLIADSGSLSLSFVRQQRSGEVTRDLVGISTLHRWGRELSLLNTLHLRPEGTTFRRLVSRLRYRGGKWNAMGEFAAFSPDVNEFSWFSDFDFGIKLRGRLQLERYLKGNDWAAGVEIALLSAEESQGYRVGPVITTPWGQAGYRFSGGEQSQSSGPWANLRVSPLRDVEVYAYGAMVSYEWDAFDIESEDLTMVQAGFRYSPPFMQKVTVNAEYQVYSTPQLDQDRRALGGLSWRFDTGGRAR